MSEPELLSTLFQSKECFFIAANQIKAEDFEIQQYQNIFRGLTNLYSGVDVDVDNLEDISTVYLLRNVVGADQDVLDIDDLKKPVSNVQYYINNVVQNSISRQIKALSSNLMVELGNCIGNKSEVIDKFKADLEEVSSRDKVESLYTSNKQFMTKYTDTFEERTAGGIDSCIPTGYKQIDKALGGGLVKKNLHVIAAPSGVGKTTFALNIAEHVAYKLSKRVDIFSLEVDAELMHMKMLSSISGFSFNSIRNGTLTHKEQELLTGKYHQMMLDKNHLVAIYNKQDLTVDSLISSVLTKHKDLDSQIGLVVVDYVQLISSKGGDAHRNQEVANISRQLKHLAARIDAPVIVISQLNRKHSTEKREGYKYKDSDLMDSSAIGNDASTIMFIDRDPRGERPDLSKIHISKGRFGGEGEYHLKFDGSKNRFTDY